MSGEFEADVAAIEAIGAIPVILEVLCRTTGMGFAAVARVTPDRWVACAVEDRIGFGLAPGGELEVETTLCHEVRESGDAVVISHVAGDGTYRHHPTPALYGLESYISVPIVRGDGRFFGTLCAIDPDPAPVDRPETISMFRLFADLIAFHLDARDQLGLSSASLLDERRTAELREQFIAVLGHDLRNPLASIASGVRLLSANPTPEKATQVLALMQGSVDRMTGLIDNVLDFARGRMGGGLTMSPEVVDVARLLTQVVEELKGSYPDRTIDLSLALTAQVHCDRIRLAQLFSNLLGNALAHGGATEPVRVEARTDDSVFELSVCNGGAPIPPEALGRLFQPFVRGAARPDQQGLGLGLYIASEIARGHGGTLEATSTPELTCFTLRMPCRPMP